MMACRPRSPLHLFLLAAVVLSSTTVLLTSVVICYAGPSDKDEGLSAFKDGLYSRARQLLIPYAESGDSASALALAEMYEEGLGVTQDYAVAFRWLTAAADQRDPVAISRLPKLASRMTLDQIDLAKKLVARMSLDPSKVQGCFSVTGNQAFNSMREKTVYGFRSDATVETMVDDIVRLSGLYRNFEIVASFQITSNAGAFIQGIHRIIAYNPTFIGSLAPSSDGRLWEA